VAKKKVAPGFWWDASAKVGYVDLRVGGRSGIRVQRTLRGVGYQKALREYGRIRDEAQQRALHPEKIPTLRQLVEEHDRLHPLKASTLNRYQYMLKGRILPAFGSTPLDRITPPRLLEFRAKLLREGLSAATANRHITLIRRFLNEAFQRGLLAQHPAPAGKVRALRESPPIPTFLTDEERKRFLAAFDDEGGFRARLEAKRRLGPIIIGTCSPEPRRYGGGPRGDSEYAAQSFELFHSAKPFFLCALDTGLTRGDIIDLRWRQLDLDAAIVSIQRAKTGVPVHIPMTRRLRDTLACLGPGAEEEHVFKTTKGEAWSETTIRRYFALAKELAGITRRFRFHDMRHDFASALVRQGVSLQVVAQLLGHTTTRMTERYAHLAPDYLRAAVNSLPDRGAAVQPEDELAPEGPAPTGPPSGSSAELQLVEQGSDGVQNESPPYSDVVKSVVKTDTSRKLRLVSG